MDIVFCRFYTRTNSGDSNSDKNGKGGVFMSEVKSMEQAQIPEDDKLGRRPDRGTAGRPVRGAAELLQG